jgi:hypothetical protein
VPREECTVVIGPNVVPILDDEQAPEASLRQIRSCLAAWASSSVVARAQYPQLQVSDGPSIA